MLNAANAQVKVHTALDDAKERLVFAGMRRKATVGPHARELDRSGDLGARGGVPDALVELHHDVGAELLGDLHVLLGRPFLPAAVVVDGAELDALVRQLEELLVREDLETARVGEDGAAPAHEPVDAAHALHEVGAGTLREMVKVVEQDLRPHALKSLGKQALDRRFGSHRHEDRRGDVAVRRVEHARARMRRGVLRNDVIREPTVLAFRLAGAPESFFSTTAHSSLDPLRFVLEILLFIKRRPDAGAPSLRF